MRRIDGQLKQNIREAIETSTYTRIPGGKFKVHTKTWEGKGKQKSLKDRTPRIMEALKGRRFKWGKGNDAPRGGAEGDHLIISRRAHKYLMDLITESND